jgi:NAD(P)-dependent dehydrogenase (short-subunit alcohol dehydrogenase family)
MNLKGKAAIVTGSGGGGSGRAIAQRFAREGASVVVSDLDTAGGNETVRLIEAEGGCARFFRADVAVEAEVRKLIAFSEQTFGGLDIIVNNASAPYHPDAPFEHWFETVQVDLLGAMYATLYGREAMLRRGGGAIVNMASISAVGHGRNHAHVPAYDVAKAGLIRLTTTLAPLGERERIRVNCLTPGWIASPEVKAYVDSLNPGERKQRGVPDVLITTEEIAGVVLRLATDETLAGRVMVWWNGRPPLLIPFGDPGYERLDSLP